MILEEPFQGFPLSGDSDKVIFICRGRRICHRKRLQTRGEADAHSWTGIGVGFKVGMRLPGVATVATVRGHGEKVFVAVHRDTPRGVRVRLEDAPWDEWIVGCADPEAVAATLAPAS